MDDFDEIISKIRRGEIILWVGSGFSRLAGYPTGSQLVSIIKEKLSPSEKQYFENKSNLDEVTEEFVQIRSREELVSILYEVFKKEPTNLMYHKLVSEIPQIETIITTNYDKSFEYAYGNDIIPIISDTDIPAISRNKANLFKIHGDIDVPSSVIITKSDYLDYHNKRKDDLIWNEIKSIVSKNSILFIGYSFADPNINSIFEYIQEKLGGLQKDCYLITRNLSDYKKRNLLDKYSIHSINMPAEEAISKIQEEVEINLIEDTKAGYIPKHLISEVYKKRNIVAEFSIGEGKKLKLDTIGSLDGNPQNEWRMDLTASSENSNKMQEFLDIVNGNTFGKCTLSQDDCIINASAKIGKILLFDPKNDNPSYISIKSNPDRLISANFTFRKSDLYLYNLKGEIYRSVSAGEIRVLHNVFDLTIKMKAGKPEQSICFNVHAKNVMEGYDIYKFINTWIEEDELVIHFDYLDVPYILPFSKMFSEKDIQLMNQNYDFYSKVFRIQKEFNVNFGDINGITVADLNTLDKIIFLLDGGKLLQTGKVASIQMEILDEEPILKALDKEVFDFTYGPIPGHHTLLGTDIALDYGLNSNDGVVVNKQEVISRLKQGLKKFTLTSESRNGTYFIGYWKILTSNQDGSLIITQIKK